jgi:N-methylhydantoinase A/oxoprolinase/acetone carboxylase beta subunit
VTVRVAVAQPGAEPSLADPPEAVDAGARDALFGGECVAARIIRGIPANAEGPAIAELAGATLVIPPGWRATHADGGTLVMERTG